MIVEIGVESTNTVHPPIPIRFVTMDELNGGIYWKVLEDDTHAVIQKLADDTFHIYGLKVLENNKWKISDKLIEMAIEIDMLKTFLLIQGL